MLRILVMVLAATNLLYFAWSRWTVEDKPVLTAVASASKPGEKKPGATPAPPPCATLGPFHDELLADQAGKLLTKAGWRLQRRDSSEDLNDGWWVYVSNANATAQTHTLEAIRRSGMRDAFSMVDDPEFRVSVGLFTDEARAEDRATKVQRLRLDAVVKERRKQQPVIWFDLPGVARETLSDGRLSDTGLPLDVLRIETCPAPSPPHAAPATHTEDAAPADGSDDALKPARTGVAAVTGVREIPGARV